MIATYCILPEKWIRPVINTIVLPAHAQTSDKPIPTGQGQYTTPGTYTFTIPAGVTSITVTLTGGGGGWGNCNGRLYQFNWRAWWSWRPGGNSGGGTGGLSTRGSDTADSGENGSVVIAY